jgi:CRISPR-associated protein Cst2
VNLFATVLTYPAPSANYRGESEENRSVIQKITYGRFEYPIISPEAMRNALREILASYGLPHNRTRLNDEDQLAVKFADYPDPLQPAAPTARRSRRRSRRKAARRKASSSSGILSCG